jgi:hypothetical protein
VTTELAKLILEAGIGIVSILAIIWAVVKIAGQRTAMLLSILADHAKERATWFIKDKEL